MVFLCVLHRILFVIEISKISQADFIFFTFLCTLSILRCHFSHFKVWNQQSRLLNNRDYSANICVGIWLDHSESPKGMKKINLTISKSLAIPILLFFDVLEAWSCENICEIDYFELSREYIQKWPNIQITLVDFIFTAFQERFLVLEIILFCWIAYFSKKTS